MKKLRKINKIGVVTLALLLIFSSISFAEIDTEVINERWGKPTYVYGETLNDDQINKTAELLDIKNRENVNYVKVTYDDLLKYIGGDPNNRANMISSVLVQKENEGKGIEVIIKTPENITQVTSLNYENASITAGVKDATIQVAAIRPVTGESALTGIYKAFEVNGEELDPERMETAQEELTVVNDITQENKDKEDFTPEEFNNIIVQIKNELSNIKINSDNTTNGETDGSGEINEDEIRKVIVDAIDQFNLENTITEDQIDRLVEYFKKYVNTDAVNSPEVQQQLKELSGKVVEGAKDIYNQAEEAGLVDQIAAFFRSIINSLVNIFTK